MSVDPIIRFAAAQMAQTIREEKNRVKPHIMTFTGRVVNPTDLESDDIAIEDIAHALACTNRFAGHAKFPISVAQHSICVARLCAGHVKRVHLQALLHDAAEAYIGDMTKFLKDSSGMLAFREADNLVTQAIFRKFGCPEAMSPVVESADRLMVRYEFEQAFGHGSPDEGYGALKPQERLQITWKWRPMAWVEAEHEFLSYFRDLQRNP